jgi:hypothetical protein
MRAWEEDVDALDLDASGRVPGRRGWQVGLREERGTPDGVREFHSR